MFQRRKRMDRRMNTMQCKGYSSDLRAKCSDQRMRLLQSNRGYEHGEDGSRSGSTMSKVELGLSSSFCKKLETLEIFK